MNSLHLAQPFNFKVIGMVLMMKNAIVQRVTTKQKRERKASSIRYQTLLSCRTLLLFLLGANIPSDDQGVISLKGLKGQLFLGLDALFLELGDLASKDGGGINGRVDTVGLD